MGNSNARFNGDIKIGNSIATNSGAEPNIFLASDGSATFAPGSDKSLKTEIIPIGTGGGIAVVFLNHKILLVRQLLLVIRPTTAAMNLL